ncbi:MAG TPA: flagellar export protein FliJ [Terriglobales bacterium]|jgi:flagellar FliJ protein|nr:flagellar export protein FliJ [Terriglobales bacterium]
MAKGFSFSLQALLRFRQSVEEQQLLRLRAANLKAAQVRNQIADLNSGLAAIASAGALELSAGVSGAQLHFDRLCCLAMVQRRSRLQEDLALCEQERMQRSEEFRQARRQREVLDRLRKQQFDRYRLQQERQEQRQFDDLLLLRRAFLDHG